MAVHIYTQTVHRTIQNKQYIEQHNNFGRVRAVPCLVVYDVNVLLIVWTTQQDGFDKKMILAHFIINRTFLV